MQALLLATGETEKLQPLTETIPSPMLPIANRPVMTYAIELLARQGIKNIHVSLYHLPGSIEAFFGKGERWGVELEYLLQRDAWGSAGALKWAESSLNDTFIVLPADMVIDLDIAKLVGQHRVRGSAATVVVSQTGSDASQRVFVGENGRLTTQLTGSTPAYATGVYIFEPSILGHIPARTPFDLRHDLLPALLAANLPIHAFSSSGYLNQLDTFPSYQEAQRTFLHNPLPGQAANGTAPLRFLSLEGRQIADGIWVGLNNVIHPSARLAAPVFIGENCRIGAGVELGPDVVIGANVIIDDEASIQKSTIFDHTYIGQLVNIEDRLVNKSLVVDTQTAESVTVEDRFLLGPTYETVAEGGGQRLFDTLLTVPLLLLLLPFLTVVAILTLITSGRVVQKKTRLKPYMSGQSVTLRPFMLYHFATRRENGRFTPLGKLWEKLSWHRLPELINILRGDLTLVGVRPLSPEEASQITETWQQKRHDAPIGFTGLWYVQNGRESDLDEMLIADVYYLATRSWREDWKLLWQTPAAWLRHSK